MNNFRMMTEKKKREMLMRNGTSAEQATGRKQSVPNRFGDALINKVLLLVAMAFCCMVGLRAQNTPEGLYMSKEFDPATNTITLEAFVTGAVYDLTDHFPNDIVIVVDQSSSMSCDFSGANMGSNVKINALKAAVTSFVNTVYQEATDKGIDHRIAIAGFGSAYRSTSDNKWYWYGTRLLSTADPKEYGDVQGNCVLTEADYRDALVSVASANGVNERLTSAIGHIGAYGNTMMHYGLEMAQGVFDNRNVTTGQSSSGQTVDRQKVVVFFSDGYPGRYESPTEDAFIEGRYYINPLGYVQCDQKTVADATVGKASVLKGAGYGARIYTVGIFGGSDPEASYMTTKSAIGARTIMLDYLSDFTCFAESDCRTLPGVDFNAGHIVDAL